MLPQGFAYINASELAAGDEMAASIPIAPADLARSRSSPSNRSSGHTCKPTTPTASSAWGARNCLTTHPTSAGYVEVGDNTGVSNGLLPEMHQCTNLQEYTHFALIDRPPPAPFLSPPSRPPFRRRPTRPTSRRCAPPPSPPDCIWFTFPCRTTRRPPARPRAARDARRLAGQPGGLFLDVVEWYGEPLTCRLGTDTETQSGSSTRA